MESVEAGEVEVEGGFEAGADFEVGTGDGRLTGDGDDQFVLASAEVCKPEGTLVRRNGTAVGGLEADFGVGDWFAGKVMKGAGNCSDTGGILRRQTETDDEERESPETG